MKRILLVLPVTIIALFLALTNHNKMLAQTLPVPVSLEVPNAPTPVKADGKIHLFYELHITNFRAKRVTLTRVEVLNGNPKAALINSYRDTKLASRLSRPGAPAELTDRRVINGGLRAVMFLELSFDTIADVPQALRHRLYFRADDAGGERGDSVIEGGRVAILKSASLVIGPPLRGAGWLATNGPSNMSGHRRALIVLDGKARIPQRFATDWVKLGSDGKLFHDSPKENENWYGYGAEVLAVANAVVVGVKNDIPENEATAVQRAVPINLETAAGNHIILDLGGKRFAVYAHLKPGSLRVKVGDRVRRGQVLASLGNTGNSDAPHLHFHIADANSSLGAEGLPFVFDSFDVEGVVASLDALVYSQAWKPQPDNKPERHRLEIPVENAVVRFP
jgi:biotin carboxyl carrier protein